MKIISIFNNKGGVGKTTLGFHLGHILAEMKYKVLFIDLDPQCNLTVYGTNEDVLTNVWEEEELYMQDFDGERNDQGRFSEILSKTRTIHFLLKPCQDGFDDLPKLPPPFNLRENLDLVPGRLTIHEFEDAISDRWPKAFAGDPLALRTILEIRKIATRYSEENNYDFIIIDTSPSLGILNKIAISTADGFIVPGLPDMFSVYGIKNIGKALKRWRKDFDLIKNLISEKRKALFPGDFVKFLGYLIYNAKKYSGQRQGLAMAHHNFASIIPETIEKNIPIETMGVSVDIAKKPIGGETLMHTHNTMPAMAQKYKLPIWSIPTCPTLETADANTIRGNASIYIATREKYKAFADDLLKRLDIVAK